MKHSTVAVMVAALCLSLVAFWFYAHSSSQSPETPIADTLSATSQQQCSIGKDKDLSVAYQVHAEVKSELNKKLIYQSTLTFNTQLQQATSSRMFGKADAIQITETLVGQAAGQSRHIDDVLYLTQTDPAPHLIFTAYDDLGLAAKHPLSILSQLVKNLSVGENRQIYNFNYDQLKGQYRYRSDADKPLNISRELISNPTVMLQHQWQTQLDQDCIPQSMQAKETLPLASGNSSGFISFSMRAERIPDYADLRKIAYSPNANQKNQWRTATVNSAEVADTVTNELQMWQLLEAFPHNKNTAELVRAVDYMINNISASELAQMIIDNSLDDNTIRDAIFGMSMSQHPQVESYMLEVLTALSSNTGNAADMQKLQLMVAISSNAQVSDVAFQTFSQLTNDTSQSENVRNTALINLGTVVQQMTNQSKDTSSLTQALSANILEQMDGQSAYAAIFSAGNAGLDRLDTQVEQAVTDKLNSSNARERYASVAVLVRDDGNYDQLITHLSTESSTLVSGAIVSGLKAEKLSSTQRSQLQTIATSATEQIQKQINQLLGS
jgi:hypothetical protein